MSIKPRKLAVDIVVVGSGAAGCAAARAAKDNGANVLLLSKDPLTASDTKIAEGIVTVRGSGDDSDTESALDLNMRLQGDDLADPKLTEAFAKDSAQAYEWLVSEGLLSSLSSVDGRPTVLHLPLGGHDRKRSVEHSNGALDYAHALWSSVQRDGDITILEDAWAIDLLTTNPNPGDQASESKQVAGLVAYHASEGEFLQIACTAVVLACGGASTLYFPCTDTMRGNSGDAYGMALRAGVPLVDMEQVQFLPFGIAAPLAYEGILAGEPVSCGPLGVLRDVNGKVILSELMVRTRAECASAIAIAVADGRGTKNGGCWLDLTANVEGSSGPLFLKIMRSKVGEILANIKKSMGQKAARFEEWWEVRPTAHYFMGGVIADSSGATELAGLFVAGQAMGGLHGSNRLGSTSLAEGAIFGRRAGAAAASYAPALASKSLDLSQQAEQIISHLTTQHQLDGGAVPPSVLDVQTKLQRAAYAGIGPARSAKMIDDFDCLVEKLQFELETTTKAGPKIWNQTLLDYLDTRNMLASAKAIAISAKSRPTSLGAHVRIDTPRRKIAKRRSIVVRMLSDGQFDVSSTQREASPKLRHFMFAVLEKGRLLRLKLLRRLPLKVRERILTNTYLEILNADRPENYQ